MFAGCAGSQKGAIGKSTKAIETNSVPADLTGTWNLQVETPSGSGTPVFELKQEGTELSGTYSGAFGSSPINGEVEGNEFTIRFTSAGMAITYTGAVTGNKMKGSVDFGGRGTGSFTGHR